MATILVPSAEALKFVSVAGQGTAIALDSGQLSFHATMLDVSVELVKKIKKPTVVDLGRAWIRYDLATSDLLLNPSKSQQLLQCKDDIFELGFAIGSLGATAAAVPIAAPSVILAGVSLMAQTLSTSVSCGNAAAILTDVVAAQIEMNFRAVAETTSALVAHATSELNRFTSNHFNPSNYEFGRLPMVSQNQFREFFDAVRICLFFDGCEMALLLRRRVTPSMANGIASGIILAFNNEFRQPHAHRTTSRNQREVHELAAQYSGQNLCQAFGRLLQRFNLNELNVR